MFSYFSRFFGSPRRVAEKRPKIPPRRPPPEPSGDPPRSLKSINFSPLGGPGVQPIICLGPPGRPQEPFGALLAPTLGPHGAQKCPGGLQALIFDPPGAPWGPFSLMMFDMFSSWFAAPFRVRFRLRARLRALLGPTWRPEVPWRAPGPPFRPSGSSLGSIFLCCC